MARRRRRRPLRSNEKAAITATIAGLLLLLSGFTGASQWHRTFRLVADVLGTSLLLRFVALVFVALGSAGGVLVLFGALSFRRDRVRMGRVLIYLGTGFSVGSLAMYIVLQLLHGDLPFAGGIGLGVPGVILSVVARFQAKATRLRR